MAKWNKKLGTSKKAQGIITQRQGRTRFDGHAKAQSRFAGRVILESIIFRIIAGYKKRRRRELKEQTIWGYNYKRTNAYRNWMNKRKRPANFIMGNIYQLQSKDQSYAVQKDGSWRRVILLLKQTK